MLQIDDVYKSYGSFQALKGVSLEVSAGDILSLLGPNGAGKTTLISIIAGLRRPDAGAVRVAGIDVLSRPAEARRCIGLAPQELGIYPTVSVRENLMYFGELTGLHGRVLAHRIEEVGEHLHLTNRFDQLARVLSGGEKRRLHTAVALLTRAPLLLLDEPTAGADVRTRADILRMVRLLAAEGSAVLYSTHYMPEVEALQSSVAILAGGQIIAEGAPSDLVARFGHSAVELVFDGPAPTLAVGNGNVWTNESVLRITSDDPAAAAARAIAALGNDAPRLQHLEIVHANLESVFLSLTGRSYSQEGGKTNEDVHTP